VWKVPVMTYHTTARGSSIKIFNYIGEIVNELKKVVWLTRREATYLTVLVLVVAIAAGIILGLLDYGFSGLVDKIFLGR
jgi:preprotein translocase subunit SecE